MVFGLHNRIFSGTVFIILHCQFPPFCAIRIPTFCIDLPYFGLCPLCIHFFNSGSVLDISFMSFSVWRYILFLFFPKKLASLLVMNIGILLVPRLHIHTPTSFGRTSTCSCRCYCLKTLGRHTAFTMPWRVSQRTGRDCLTPFTAPKTTTKSEPISASSSWWRCLHSQLLRLAMIGISMN